MLQYLASKVLKGELEQKDMLLGSHLIPLQKENGKVRPIACGELFFRVISRAAVRQINFKCSPYQLGVGTRNGVEPILEALRIKCRNREIIALDLKNAFNTIKRKLVLEEAKRLIPKLWRFIRWGYEDFTKLYLPDGSIMLSKSGVKQGDPISPLLFSIGYDVVLRKLRSRLNENGIQESAMILAYLDDTYVSCKNGLTLGTMQNLKMR